MIVEPYNAAHHEACVQIFESNCPAYFAPEEMNYLQRWLNGLDTGTNPYATSSANYFYVGLVNGRVIGCAGFYVTNETPLVTLTWGMIANSEHGKGYGKELFAYRVNVIKQLFPEHKIILNTSQHTFRFFEKLGFKVVKITPNGYGEGLDRYDMA